MRTLSRIILGVGLMTIGVDDASASTVHHIQANECFPINGSQVSYSGVGVTANTASDAQVMCPLPDNWKLDSAKNAAYSVFFQGHNAEEGGNFTCGLVETRADGTVDAITSTIVSGVGFGGPDFGGISGTTTNDAYRYLVCSIPGQNSFGSSYLTTYDPNL